MPKINYEEYEVLKELDDKWKWIARDEAEGMFLFVEKPYKYEYFPQWRNYTCDWKAFETEVFQFIQWEDEEPYEIAELIREYEWAQLNEKYPPVRESEGKEVKDLEWAKNEIENLYSLTFDAYRAAFKANNEHFEKENSTQLALISKVLEILDQLDEPETLSPEWIEEHTYYEDEYDFYCADPDELKNLLVPTLSKMETVEITEEPETVADVVTTFWKSYERLKEVMSMEVKELEE